MLYQAAVLADDYSLTHRSAFLPSDNNNSGGNRYDKSIRPPTPRTTSGCHCTHLDIGRHDGAKRSHSVICNYCKRRGHVMAECWLLQQKKQPNAIVHSVQEPFELSLRRSHQELCLIVIMSCQMSGQKGSHKILALIGSTFHLCQMV